MALFLPTDTFAYIGLDEKIHRVDGTDVIDKGFWSASIAYNGMEVVQYDNMLFVALTANFNMPPTAIVDENWSSLVRTSGAAIPSDAEIYQIAVSGSILAYSLYGTILSGNYPPDSIRCAVIDWGTTAEQVNAAQMPYISDTYPTVQAALDALLYVPLQVTSFGNSVGVAELGASVASAQLTWVYNKSVVSQSIDLIGVLPPTLRTINDGDGPWTANRTWLLVASDGTNSASRSTSLVFMQKRYWGADASVAIDDAGILLLSSEFASSFAQSRTITAAAQYIYFAFPTSFGTPQFTVNGLLNTAWTKTTRTFVNASGYSSSYDIWRSDNLLTGTYNITLS